MADLDILKAKVDELMSQISEDISKVCEKRRKLLQQDDGLLSSIRFSERLATFSLPNWKTKPKEVLPRLFASRGWRCVDNDLLQCVVCKKYIDSRIPSLLNVELAVYTKIVKNLCAKVVTAHELTCIFHCCAAEDALYTNDKKQLFDELMARCNSMNDLDFSGINIIDFPSITTQTVANLEAASRQHAILTCSGWSKSDVIYDALHCVHCFRTLGLWLYRNSNKELNPENEHHRWCAFVELNEKNVPMWQRIVRDVLPNHLNLLQDQPKVCGIGEPLRILRESVATTEGIDI